MAILIAKSSAPPPPDPPGSFTATRGDETSSTISVSWTASAGADSYRVYLSETNAKGSLLASGVVSPYVVTNLDPETQYWITVEAVNAGGTTDSNRVTGTTTAPASGILFASAWAYERGTSTAAARDGAKWDTYRNFASGSGGNAMTVVDGAALGFPTPNAIAWQHYGHGGDVEVTFAHRTLEIGESYNWRIYTRMDISDSRGNLSASSYHPWQNRAGTPEWEFKFGPRSNGTFTVIWQFEGQTTSSNGWGTWGAQWTGTLAKHQVHMLEQRLTKVGTDQWKLSVWKLSVRINGVVIDGQLMDDQWGPARSLTTSDPTFTIPEARLRQLFVGQNGPGWPNNEVPGDNHSWAGMAVRLNDWCGPYTPGEEG